MHFSCYCPCPSHAFKSRDSACLLSELATGWKAGSGIHSALGRLATPEFIDEESLFSSRWDVCYDFDQFICHLVEVARVAEPLLAHRAGERQLPGVDESVLGQVLRVPEEIGILE